MEPAVDADDLLYASVEDALARGGPAGAIADLAEALEGRQDYHRLFEVRLLRARHELGLPLLAKNSASDLEPATRDVLEAKMIEACREVGAKMLAVGDVLGAYSYLDMIGELAEIRVALESANPAAEDVGSYVELALGRGVHPARGIELVLEHYGLCQAISACENVLRPGVLAATRDDCIRLVLAAAHDELRERLTRAITEQEQHPPGVGTIADWVADRPELFADDNYHIDTSHLSAVVRMARLLPAGKETGQAIDLCAYGRGLSMKYRYPDPPPFEDLFEDSLMYFRVLAGTDVEAGLRHFHEKTTANDSHQAGTYAMEVYLRLLLALGRPLEALGALSHFESSVPSSLVGLANEICEAAEDLSAMARLARQRQDPVRFLAAKLQQAGQPSRSP